MISRRNSSHNRVKTLRIQNILKVASPSLSIDRLRASSYRKDWLRTAPSPRHNIRAAIPKGIGCELN